MAVVRGSDTAMFQKERLLSGLQCGKSGDGNLYPDEFLHGVPYVGKGSATARCPFCTG
jgi:hypothetical protein